MKRQVRQGNELEIESNKHRGKDKNKMEDQGKGLRRYIKVTWDQNHTNTFKKSFLFYNKSLTRKKKSTKIKLK